ncbi:hypothetical protein [Desulfosporosinus nitroreducens]|nr:hypothetical protein [Desulfosporosinus nitroreducens]MCO1601008.1 hypothetical protein [Desulfosporosinus nitroreducens]
MDGCWDCVDAIFLGQEERGSTVVAFLVCRGRVASTLAWPCGRRAKLGL